VAREEDWYLAQCLEVDVASQGHTIDGALANLAEAVDPVATDQGSTPRRKTGTEQAVLVSRRGIEPLVRKCGPASARESEPFGSFRRPAPGQGFLLRR
jgi:hypothetical protein